MDEYLSAAAGFCVGLALALVLHMVLPCGRSKEPQPIPTPRAELPGCFPYGVTVESDYGPVCVDIRAIRKTP